MEFLNEGDVIELKEGHDVYADVPKHFVYADKKGCWDLCHEKVTIDGDFDFLKGRYVVVSTCMRGGDQASDGSYPDGHQVTCEKVDDRSIRVDFYQNGSFTATIRDISPIGRAVLSWKVQDTIDEEPTQ